VVVMPPPQLALAQAQAQVLAAQAQAQTIAMTTMDALMNALNVVDLFMLE